jgi:hypothetical protein
MPPAIHWHRRGIVTVFFAAIPDFILVICLLIFYIDLNSFIDEIIQLIFVDSTIFIDSHWIVSLPVHPAIHISHR